MGNTGLTVIGLFPSRFYCEYYHGRRTNTTVPVRGSSSVHLVLSWPQHIKSWERYINLWERDIMSWPRDRFVEVTTSLCRGLEMLC